MNAACSPAAGSTAIESHCEATSMQPMNLDAFTTVVKKYTKLPPKDASRFLIDTNDQDPGLAETLMLYQRHLQQPAEMEAAFLFYVINTKQPL